MSHFQTILEGPEVILSDGSTYKQPLQTSTWSWDPSNPDVLTVTKWELNIPIFISEFAAKVYQPLARAMYMFSKFPNIEKLPLDLLDFHRGRKVFEEMIEEEKKSWSWKLRPV